MDVMDLVSATSALVSLALLLVVWLLVRNYRVDRLREQLFQLRDEMFLYAVDQELVGSPAYTELRVLMNALIRYAHQVSVSRLVLLTAGVSLLRMPRTMPENFGRWAAATDALPADQRARFVRFHTEAMKRVAVHLVFGCPAVWLLMAGIAVWAFVIKPTTAFLANPAWKLPARVIRSLDLMEAEALRTSPNA
jgi:hypothetical protein